MWFFFFFFPLFDVYESFYDKLDERISRTLEQAFVACTFCTHSLCEAESGLVNSSSLCIFIKIGGELDYLLPSKNFMMVGTWNEARLIWKQPKIASIFVL